ncbi:MAG: ATP-dependent Clp protease proteolytic subunit [Verrucomicrobia bacterium]|nr:ATP-dependent Clp protease proteolytic subunit [Verrucomicrobiota bacterium]
MHDNQEESKETPPLRDKIETALLQSRRILLSDGIDFKIAEELIKKLWYLEHQDPGKPILFVINSPGGVVDAGFAVWDQIQMISSPVTTLITGLAASMGSFLALSGAPGRRFATPNSRIMIHQPAIGGVIQGQATDLEIQAREILKTKEAIIKVYAEKTGKSYAEIEEAIDRDMWMSAEEALAFGHIDRIVNSYKDL